MKIYIVEHRQQWNNDNRDEEYDFAYAASSIENAEKFMKANTDYAFRNTSTWWWAVFAEELDAELDTDGFPIQTHDELYIYDWDGNKIVSGEQPINGYNNLTNEVDELYYNSDINEDIFY